MIWPRRHIFGAPECPLMYRWHLLNLGDMGKVMLHRFLPDRRETDLHDHPRSFLTIVLRGGYDDVRLEGLGEGSPTLMVDHVRAPAVRFRRAEHAHRTEAGPRGAWTICFLGPRRRAWGFFRYTTSGALGWLPWREHERRYGSSFRCE